jgi:hypothetical protein
MIGDQGGTMTLPAADDDTHSVPQGDTADLTADSRSRGGEVPPEDDTPSAEPQLEVDREARRLQDGSEVAGPSGTSEAERIAQRPDF